MFLLSFDLWFDGIGFANFVSQSVNTRATLMLGSSRL
jgi:hypothetical protein